MTELAETIEPTATARPRRIVHQTRGRTHGPITRLMSPGDLGEVLKPFVFLDHFDLERASFPGLGLHPHSGIATVTHLFEGDVRYEDTTGRRGLLQAGGLEWFKAAQGAWHGGGAGDQPRGRGFQLWLSLPEAHELGEVESVYLEPADMPGLGPARLLLGDYGGQSSAIRVPSPLTYLAVRLQAGERWRYEPGPGHTAAWLAVSRGRLLAPDAVGEGALAVFEPSTAPIDVLAETATELVIGSAAPQPHDLVLGYYSVHTSTAALEAGERRIQEVRRELRREGRL